MPVAARQCLCVVGGLVTYGIPLPHASLRSVLMKSSGSHVLLFGMDILGPSLGKLCV
jgi:hypothetical protein